MLKRIEKWLFTPRTGTYVIMLACLLFLFKLLWAPFITKVFIELFAADPIYTKIVLFCIITALWEEFIYRAAPILVAKNINVKLVPIAMIASSIIFGFDHTYQTGIREYHLMLQGVGGLALAVAYVKSNYNFWVPVTMHTVWNLYALNIIF